VATELTPFNSLTFQNVLPEPVEVTLVEYIPYEAGKREDGTSIIRRRISQRTTEIGSYVPMKVFHRMMASQGKIKQFQKLANGKGEASIEDQQQMLDWMAKQVLEVWKLTEPDMTEDALVEGLDFQKILALFQSFFGDQLKQLGEQVKAL
jgi:hypothetical protein